MPSYYYTWGHFSAQIGGERLTFVGKPGVWSWHGLNEGTAALLEVTSIGAGEAVLDLGCGTGVIGVVGGRRARPGRVTLVDCSLPAVECARRSLAANDITNGEVLLSDGVTGLTPCSYDLVLSHLPRERAVQEELLRGAAWVLRPGGRLYFVAHRRAGIRGAVEYARRLFGRCGVIRQKKGYHVAMTIKPPTMESPPPETGFRRRTVYLDGRETILVGKPGVFAWNRLDPGTAALVRAMEISPTDRVLDLGCGTGLVGVAASRRTTAGTVTLADGDLRAVEAALRTLAANGLPGEVMLSDCGSALFGRVFDVVVTNPPFHQGRGVEYDVARRFIRDGARLLRPGGRFYLVANRFLRYDPLIRAAFGECETVYDDGRYRVLRARLRHRRA